MLLDYADDLEVCENPLDALETTIVAGNEWPFERNGDTKMAFAIGGSFSQYHLWFGWQEQAASLHLRCGYDFTVSRSPVPQHLRGVGADQRKHGLWLF